MMHTVRFRHAASKAALASCIGLLVMVLTARPAGAAEDAALMTLPAAGSMQTLLDCRLWLSAVSGCPRLSQAAARNIAAGSPTSGLSGAPDADGIKRDTYYFLGLQLSVIGVLYVMPESVSGWSDEQKEQHRADKWWNNVSGPTWDEDEHYINYVLHPYWGAAYYVRARERGYGPQGAFWYSVLLSTLYETGVEAMFEPVSIQDFFVTPIVGSWLGGYFMEWRRSTQARIATTGERRFRDKALLVATDPLGNAADFVDHRLGRQVEFAASPFIMPGAAVPAHPGFGRAALPKREPLYGVTLTLRW